MFQKGFCNNDSSCTLKCRSQQSIFCFLVFRVFWIECRIRTAWWNFLSNGNHCRAISAGLSKQHSAINYLQMGKEVFTRYEEIISKLAQIMQINCLIHQSMPTELRTYSTIKTVPLEILKKIPNNIPPLLISLARNIRL